MTPGFKAPIVLAGETTLTGKNQITLPAEAVRLLGLKNGDRLIVQVLDEERLILTPKPANWTDHFSGKLGDVFGTPEEVRAYLEGERANWDGEPD